MELIVDTIVPSSWKIELSKNDTLTVSYTVVGRGNNPKPFIFPKTISIDPPFMAAIGMYIGDGKLSKDLHHLEFTSIDPDMLEFMRDFFTQRLGVDPSTFYSKKYAFQI